MYWTLGVLALVNKEYTPAALCFVIPFLGWMGMFAAAIVAILFWVDGEHLFSALSIGLVILNLVGNHLLDRGKTSKK
jgi:hypothetical protein